jgi:hypothetical protein
MRFVLTVLTLVLALLTVARADEYTDHLEAGARYISTDELRYAFVEYQAAYQLHQTPSLLLMLARIERRLGHVEKAIDLFRRWLASDDVDNAAARPEAQAAITELEKLRPPPPAPVVNSPFNWQLRPVRIEKRPNTGLIAGGATLFSLSYGAAALAGGAFASVGGGCYSSCSGNLSVAGGLLFIPFLGPFITSAALPQAAWGVPWALVDGTAQIAGLAMMIAGRRYLKDYPIYGKVNIAPYAGSNTAGLSLTGRF